MVFFSGNLPIQDPSPLELSWLIQFSVSRDSVTSVFLTSIHIPNSFFHLEPLISLFACCLATLTSQSVLYRTTPVIFLKYKCDDVWPLLTVFHWPPKALKIKKQIPLACLKSACDLVPLTLADLCLERQFFPHPIYVLCVAPVWASPLRAPSSCPCLRCCNYCSVYQ